jgi:uncharacterized membrane protein YkgB
MTFVRVGLIALLAYFGALKLTYWDSELIRPLVEHSPLLSWMYGVWEPRVVAGILGAIELLAAALLATRPWSPFFCLVGSFLAVAVFLTTLSFLFTTPDLWEAAEGFPLPRPRETAAFILKDVVLLGAAAMSAVEARKAMSVI